MQTSMKNVLPLPIDEYHSLFLKSMFRKYALSTDSSWSMHISLNHEMILITFYFSLNSEQKFEDQPTLSRRNDENQIIKDFRNC